MKKPLQLATLLTVGLLGAPARPDYHMRFTRGDLDETGRADVTDAVRIFRYLFLGDPDGLGCLDAADVDDNGDVEVTDGIYLLEYLFRGGRRIPEPFTECAHDWFELPDDLGCERFGLCGSLPSHYHFYGQEYAGGGIFVVVEASAHMENRGELRIAKLETLLSVLELEAGVQFGLVFYASAVKSFPGFGPPAEADPPAKEAAAAWVKEVSGGAGSCIQDALRAALRFVDSSSAERNVILYAGTGDGHCQGRDEERYLNETLDAVTRENAGRAQINTLGLFVESASLQESFLAELAARNGGSFVVLRN